MNSASLLDRILARAGTADEQPFALLHRPASTGPGLIEVIAGPVTTTGLLAGLPLATESASPGPELLALVPYRQVRERGFDCHDDGEQIIAMRVAEYATEPLSGVLARLPDQELALTGGEFDIGDEDYAQIVRDVIKDEIGSGEGSNFVVRRTFTGELRGWSAAAALSLFRRLLTGELGAYWTFLVYTGDRTFVGATPERHVSLTGGIATMNPISGTYRYPGGGPSLDGLLKFLRDQKETEELYMVVDEELKMMAAVCDAGGQVRGPYLREMARLAHTEYLLEGRSRLNARDLLRATLFAPTVTGSPIENACRVLARHEPNGRGFYSGVIALAGWDAARTRQLDSAILIRTADIGRHGKFSLGVGATLVRNSEPDAEVAETWAKAAAMLTAAGLDSDSTQAPPAAPARSAASRRLAVDRGVRAALTSRNTGLAQFWFSPVSIRARGNSGLAGRDVLVVDAEDTFTGMLAHQLRALGPDVRVEAWRTLARRPELAAASDIVVLGPGPGDPADPDDPRITTMRALALRLFRRRAPFVAICLSHQVLAHSLRLPVARKAAPSQGEQREIDLFGEPAVVGFYNTFAAFSGDDELADPRGHGLLQVSRDHATGEVHALRGAGFASLQFHPESVLTQHGPGILTVLLDWAADRRGLLAA